MWAGVIRLGLPSTTSKPTFISGIDFSALTSAKPIRWVKETLPPRARARWLLMTIRLSQSSLTGTERTLVAVGTREAGVHVGHRAGGGAAQHGVGGLVRGRLGLLVRLVGPAWCPACFSAVALPFVSVFFSVLLSVFAVGLAPAFVAAFSSSALARRALAVFVGLSAVSGRLLGAPVDSFTAV